MIQTISLFLLEYFQISEIHLKSFSTLRDSCGSTFQYLQYEVSSCCRISFEAFFRILEALEHLQYEVRPCFRNSFVIFVFATERTNFVLVELSVTEKLPGRSLTSKYVLFFNVPATTSVTEYPQFIESLSTALINQSILSKQSQRC